MGFRKIIPCPNCDGSGSLSIIDHAAMTRARHAKGINIKAMARKLKLGVLELNDIERGWSPMRPEVESAYLLLLPKKARGGP